MAIDPATGINIPSPSDDFRRRRPDEPIRDQIDRAANDEVGIAQDIEERSPAFWLPIAVAVVLLMGVIYYFFGPGMSGPNVRADAGATVKSELSPN
jgi:hypothetical protein